MAYVMFPIQEPPEGDPMDQPEPRLPGDPMVQALKEVAEMTERAIDVLRENPPVLTAEEINAAAEEEWLTRIQALSASQKGHLIPDAAVHEQINRLLDSPPMPLTAMHPGNPDD